MYDKSGKIQVFQGLVYTGVWVFGEMKKEKFDIDKFWKKYKSLVRYLNRCEYKLADSWMVVGALQIAINSFFKPKAGDGQ